jgi:hypothetical protein
VTLPIPYPADTRAKGWRFEIDHERIEQSDTWSLAGAEVRPWLLMLWMTAWKQTPCGSLSDDDALVAAKMGMPPKAFAKHRAILMRGWWKAEDGRLYHDTIVQRVLSMLDKRATDAQRAAGRRARKAESAASPPEVTRDTPVTPPEVGPEFDTKHQAPSTSKPSLREGSRKRASAPVRPDDVPEGVWADWLQLRRDKRAPVTDTVLDGARAESVKAGMPLEDFLRVWCVRGSQGLQADWLRPDERARSRPHGGETAYQQSQRERVAEFAPGVAKRGETFDMESTNVVALAGR